MHAPCPFEVVYMRAHACDVAVHVLGGAKSFADLVIQRGKP